MGKKRKTNNKDAGKKSKKQATPRATSAAPAASPAGAMSDTFTLDEVAKHNTRDDLWVAVAGSVYDVRCSLCCSFLPALLAA